MRPATQGEIILRDLAIRILNEHGIDIGAARGTTTGASISPASKPGTAPKVSPSTTAARAGSWLRCS
jgi:hypothetical protein